MTFTCIYVYLTYYLYFNCDSKILVKIDYWENKESLYFSDKSIEKY